MYVVKSALIAVNQSHQVLQILSSHAEEKERMNKKSELFRQSLASNAMILRVVTLFIQVSSGQRWATA